MYVIENYRHPVTRCLGQPNIARNDRFKDFVSKETSQISCYLLREGRPVVVHREEYAFDLESWIYSPAEAHERIQKLRHTLNGEIFALNRYKNSVTSS